jgi:hypothetical protein
MKALLLSFRALYVLALCFSLHAHSQTYTWVTVVQFPQYLGSVITTNSASGPGLSIDPGGNIFVADTDLNTIKRISLVWGSWQVTDIAGLFGVTGSTDGTNSQAKFFHPCGITTDGTNFFITDGNQKIRRVAPAGTNWVVKTLAGGGSVSGSGDGTNETARFSVPMGIAVDTSGKLYVSDWGWHRIRQLTPSGTNSIVTTIAGLISTSPGHLDGTNRDSSFWGPYGACVSRSGTVYVTDSVNDTIRQLRPEGTNWIVTTIAGMALQGGSADGTNHDALFRLSTHMAMDMATNLYVADNRNQTIRKITPLGTNWVTTTIGGTAGLSGNSDGVGTDARFFRPGGIAVDPAGSVYVTDWLNYSVRKGVPFTISQFPQSEGVPSGTSVTLNTIVSDGTGPFTYQWYFNHIALAGQTNNVLYLGPMGRTNTGVYVVVVTDAKGNSITLTAIARALFQPVILQPQVKADGTVRVIFQDADGGLPYDLNQVQAEYCSELPSGGVGVWLPLPSAAFLTNGYAAFDDTDAPGSAGRFYRIVEW